MEKPQEFNAILRKWLNGLKGGDKVESEDEETILPSSADADARADEKAAQKHFNDEL
jgi:hypothetical protein